MNLKKEKEEKSILLKCRPGVDSQKQN